MHRSPIVVQGALLAVALSVAVVSSAGPPLIGPIEATNKVSPDVAQWSLTINSLIGAVATPVMARAGRGRFLKQCLIVGVGCIALGCGLAALPLGMVGVFAGRGLQGMGLALVPLTVAAASSVLPAPEAARTAALLSVAVVSGIGIGYPVVSALAVIGGYRLPFLLGTVLSVVVLIGVVLIVPAAPTRIAAPGRADPVGTLLLSVGLAGLVLTLADAHDWTAPTVVVAAGSTVAVLGLWAVVEVRHPDPLIAPRALIRPALALTHLTTATAGAGMYLLLPALSRMLTEPPPVGLGWSTVPASFCLVPFSVGTVAATAASRRASDSVRRHLPLVASLAASLGMAAYVVANGRTWVLGIAAAAAGAGVGSVFAAAPERLLSSARPAEARTAVAVDQAFRYVGYAIGSALCATLLSDADSLHRGATVIGSAGVAIWVTAAATAAMSRAARPSAPEG